ncbi:MAG: flavodoxin family protein [Sedimentisphaerales bacterium]|nr:flavodoxin family protein [Sedimentisphaerales bacterium]
MANKIVILTSSPRPNGNTNTIVKWVTQAAQEAHATVDIIDIAHLKYATNGCTACMACQQSHEFRCVIDDQASPLIASLPEYDVIVTASPIYYMGLNAQAKLFLDRTFSLIKINLETGEITPASTKPITQALIATAGGGIDDSGIKLAEQTCQSCAAFTGAKFLSLLVPNAPMFPGEIESNTKIKTQAQQFGKKLASA